MKLAYAAALALLCAPAAPASAQWASDLDENFLVSTGSNFPQNLPYSASAPDGSTYVAWLSWEDQNAHLKLQRLGFDGTPALGEGGKYISRNPTSTWSSGFALLTDRDGNAIIIYPDKRNGAWQIYGYKVSPQGEMLWGDEGIYLADNAEEGCFNPHAVLTDKGNIVVGYQSLYTGHNTLKVLKLNPDGTKAWGGVIESRGTNGLFELVAGENDSFYQVWIIGDAASVAVSRFTANGEPAWEEDVLVDVQNAVVGSEPKAASDGRGGVLVSWRHASSQFNNEGCFQRVAPDGAMLWDDSLAFDNLPIATTDANGNIYMVVTNDKDGDDNLFVSKFAPSGEFLGSTGSLLSSPADRVSVYGLAVDGNHVALAYRNASALNEATIEYAHIGADCNPVVRQGAVATGAGNKGFGMMTYSGQGQAVVAWENSANQVMAQNFSIDLTAGIASVATEGSDSGAVYTLTGICLWRGPLAEGMRPDLSLAPGVYILQSGSHSSKFIVK